MSPRVTVSLAIALALVAAYIFVVDRPQAQRAEQAKHLIQLSKGDITGIALESPKGHVDLARLDATHWQLTRPVQAPAATFAVSDLLDAVTGLTSQRTLSGAGQDLAAYGLDKPAAQITLHPRSGEAVTLAVGKASSVATAVYARVVPGSSVFLVDNSLRDTLSKSTTELRQKTLADFTNADVQKVQVRSPKGTLAVDRLGPDRWRLQGAQPWPADDFKVSDLFFPLTTSEAKVFHDGVTDLAPYGLDHPEVTMDLSIRGRLRPLRVLLTRRGKVAYGMIAGTQTVVELDPSLQDKLTPDPIQLVSTRVLPYNAQDLTAVVWRRNGRSLEFHRQGPGFTGGGLRDKDISDMFLSLNILDADKVEALSSPPTGSPTFGVQTEGAEDATFRLAFYRQPQGAWLATDPALGLQYRLSPNALDGFPQPIKSFLGLEQAKKPSPPTASPPAPSPKTPKRPTAPASP
jgi:hypothetical protein